MLDAKDIVVGAEVVVTDHLGRKRDGRIVWVIPDGYEVSLPSCVTGLTVEDLAPLPFRDISLKESSDGKVLEA